MKSVTLLMPLLNEGTQVWRPVEAEEPGLSEYMVRCQTAKSGLSALEAGCQLN